MATLECAVILLLVILSSCSVSWSTKNPYEENIGLQCGFTRHPSLCAETLRVSGSRNQADFISVLVNKTIYESKLPVSNFEQLSVHFVSREAQHARMAIGTSSCYFNSLFFHHAIISF